MSEWVEFTSVEELNEHREAIKAFLLSRDPDYSKAYVADEEKRRELQTNWDSIVAYIEEHGLLIEDWHGIFSRLQYRVSDDKVHVKYVAGQYADEEYITLGEYLTVKNSTDGAEKPDNEHQYR